MSELVLLQQDHGAEAVCQRASRRDPGDPGADHDDVGVTPHAGDPTGTARSDRGDSPRGPRCGPRRRARESLVGLGEVARVPGRLRRLDRPDRLGHVGVERLLAVGELRLA